MNTSWYILLQEACKATGDNFETLICTLTKEEMREPFGITPGLPFTAWSDRYVYFPAMYDGSVWVEWVSRSPNNKPTKHVGG